MIKPAFLLIGMRYVRAKRRHRFLSFISVVSIFGIALGVTALITVLSVMNGFDQQIRKQLFSFAPAITVTGPIDTPKTQDKITRALLAMPGTKALAPFVIGKGMLIHAGEVNGVEVLGVDPQKEGRVSGVPSSVKQGSFQQLTPGSFNIVIGEVLASRLGVILGDSVTLLTPQASATPFGLMPRYRRLRVVGIFKTGSGFGFDSSVAYVALKDASRLFLPGQFSRGLHIKISRFFQAPALSMNMQDSMPLGYLVSNWTQTYGPLFKALAMEKTMMFVILLLIVAVAAFNLVSTLMMTVNDKRTDIAILRTMGAPPRMILMVFITQGALIGFFGVLIGLCGGVTLALNATHWVDAIQKLFHVKFLSSSVYFVDFLPSHLLWRDVLTVCAWAWGFSILATLYPASVASKVEPAEALRYD